MSQNNWSQQQYQQMLNAFWSRIGVEQNTNRLVIHDGNMRNLTYMDNWQVLNQNGSIYLYDLHTQRLFDRQLNYYYQGNYYDIKGNLLRDYVSESVIDVQAKDVKQAIKKDPVFGTNGYSNKNTYYTNNNSINNNSRINISNNPYIINNDSKFKHQQQSIQTHRTQQNQQINFKQSIYQNNASLKAVNSQQQEIDRIVKEQLSLKAKQEKSIIKTQQEKIDEIVKEQLALKEKQKKAIIQQQLTTDSKQKVNKEPEKKLVKKTLSDVDIQQKTNILSNNTKQQVNSKIDLKSYGNLSMTKKVDEFSKMKTNNNSKSTYKSKPRYSYNNKGPNSSTVGKMIVGLTDFETDKFAAKIAADFSSYKYGKVLSKLFRF